MDARIIPTPSAGNVSIARAGSPSSASKSPSVNKTRLASPTMNINAMNGVCQTKNQIMACFLSLSDLSVMTRETTCGCPATPKPPKKNATKYSEIPREISVGKKLTRVALCDSRFSCMPEKPPTLPSATQQRITEPTIMTQDCAASVQIDARIPPA